MSDKALTRHPATGQPIRRVITGGLGLITVRSKFPTHLSRSAREWGVRFTISSDSHSVRDFVHLRYAMGQARRGWLTKDDVINTWPLAKLRRFLRKGRPA